MRFPAVSLCAALLAGACAVVPDRWPPVTGVSQDSADRGRQLAQQTCARCHAVGAAGESSQRRAPTFRALSGRYVSVSLQRKLTEIAETGHYDMPALLLHSDQVEDVVAYINSFEPQE
ncbi:c-type cytochrome [Phenylobacterium sp.]|uniref:c-type cytochrome n=1 Tax=Phenylobacterium sp. TaxID=1871053 RepID=UPI00398320F6